MRDVTRQATGVQRASVLGRAMGVDQKGFDEGSPPGGAGNPPDQSLGGTTTGETPDLAPDFRSSTPSAPQGRLDTARYPPGGGVSKNVVTHVEVSVPQRTLTKDEVRVTEGGPGMGFVVVTIGGRRSFLVDYTFTVYGREVGAAKLEKVKVVHTSPGESGTPCTT